MASKKQFNFRKARKDDIKIVKEMIQEFADFAQMSDGPKLSEKDLIRDSGLEGGPEVMQIYVLDLIEADQTIIIGYASGSVGYTSWRGKIYCLDQMFIRPAYRGIGAGTRLLSEVAAKANEYQCKYIHFYVLSWNSAAKFYKKFGAIDMSETKDYRRYRLEEQQIERLTQQLLE